MLKNLIIGCFILINFAPARVNPGGLENALDISTSGVVAQRMRMEVIAENIANVDTVKTEAGTPYNRKVAILQPVEYFAAGKSFYSKGLLNGVRVAAIKEEKNVHYNKIYDPKHPEADEEGYIYYPNIDLTKELVEMTGASNAFESNVVVFNTTKAMMQSSLEIGR